MGPEFKWVFKVATRLTSFTSPLPSLKSKHHSWSLGAAKAVTFSNWAETHSRKVGILPSTKPEDEEEQEEDQEEQHECRLLKYLNLCGI